MKSAAICLSAMMVLLGCGDGGESGGGQGPEEPPIVAGDTPEKTFLAMKEALLREDYEAFFGLWHPSVREEHQGQFKKARESESWDRQAAELAKKAGRSAEEIKRMDDRELVLLSIQTMFTLEPGGTERYTGARVGKTDIDGDKALVHFETGGKQHNTSFVMHEGKWYYHPWP